MARYWTCRYGANHDFGEKCDCAEAAERERKKQEQLIVKEKGTGQLVLRWPPERAAGCRAVH